MSEPVCSNILMFKVDINFMKESIHKGFTPTIAYPAPSSPPLPLPFVFEFDTLLFTEEAAAAAPGATRSFEVNKLWKKFCRTSCCVCPLVGGGPGDDDDVGNAVGDVGGRPSGGDVATADNIVGGCLPVALPDTLRVGSTPAITPTPPTPAPAPPTT